MKLTFVLAPSYLASAKDILSDEEQRALEAILLRNPEAGDTVGGTGGVRKVRIALPGRGKSGGARVLYFYVSRQSRVYLLLAYAKNESVNVSAEGKKMLRGIVRLIEKES